MTIIRNDILKKRDSMLVLLSKADTMNEVKFYQGAVAMLSWVLDPEKPADGFSA